MLSASQVSCLRFPEKPLGALLEYGADSRTFLQFVHDFRLSSKVKHESEPARSN